MIFSLIIPCYNSSKTINRLFNSLIHQDIDKNDLQVIVVDDDSPDKSFLDIIKTYEDKLNIEYYSTDTNCHCPGNTRREGMKHIKGDWVFFCDHDDYFEENVFGQIKEYILNLDHKCYVIHTIMNSYNEEKQKYTHCFKDATGWLHGQFYNMKDLIIPYNINFKEDLKTHEDIYFNSCVTNVLLETNSEYTCLDINTYKWVDEPTSLTRRPYNDRGYFYENFNDYVESAAGPFWENAIKTREEKYINQIMMTLVHCYFYYESASYYCGPNDFVDIAKHIQNLIKKILYSFNIALDDIVDFVYLDPIKFKLIREQCEILTGPIIPKTSLRDFIYYLGSHEI